MLFSWTICKQSFLAEYVNIVYVPDGTESSIEVDEFDSETEEIDVEMDGDRPGGPRDGQMPDQPDARNKDLKSKAEMPHWPLVAKKRKQTPKKSDDKAKSSRKRSGRAQHPADNPKWVDYDQHSLVPQKCGMITDIVTESNKYGEQQSDFNPHITAEEIEELCVGIMFLMSVVKMSSFRMY
uniref:(northern house mosquito) hypothetical protein n=1 Tax=Culex pipiens TaxID=7175 RepID=A0A8D8FIQ9_CULPI